MTETDRRRLRLAAGLTLFALAVLILIGGTLLALGPGIGEPVWVYVSGEPTLLAAIAVLRGGTKGGAFGGLVSLLYVPAASSPRTKRHRWRPLDPLSQT